MTLAERPWHCIFCRGWYTLEQGDEFDQTCPQCGGKLFIMAGSIERKALHSAHRALMHADRWFQAATEELGLPLPNSPIPEMIKDALREVSYVLDVGRDESEEQIAT